MLYFRESRITKKKIDLVPQGFSLKIHRRYPEQMRALIARKRMKKKEMHGYYYFFFFFPGVHTNILRAGDMCRRTRE